MSTFVRRIVRFLLTWGHAPVAWTPRPPLPLPITRRLTAQRIHGVRAALHAASPPPITVILHQQPTGDWRALSAALAADIVERTGGPR